MTIADRLKEAMKAGDGREAISQNALSRLSGVPQPTIARILKGGGPSGPETSTLMKLANARKVEFLWLQQGVGPKYPGMPAGDVSNRIEFAPAVDHDDGLKQGLRLMTLFERADDRGRMQILRLAEKLGTRRDVNDAAGDES